MLLLLAERCYYTAEATSFLSNALCLPKYINHLPSYMLLAIKIIGLLPHYHTWTFRWSTGLFLSISISIISVSVSVWISVKYWVLTSLQTGDFSHRAFPFTSLSTQSLFSCGSRIHILLLSNSLIRHSCRGWKGQGKAAGRLPHAHALVAVAGRNHLYFRHSGSSDLSFSFSNFTVLTVVLNSSSVCGDIFCWAWMNYITAVCSFLSRCSSLFFYRKAWRQIKEGRARKSS